MALNSYLHQKGRRTLQPMVSMCLPAANPQAHDSLLPSMVKWQRGVLEPSQGSASQSYDKQSRRHHGWIELFQTKKGGCNAAERKKQGKHSLDSLEKIWLAHIIAPTSNCASWRENVKIKDNRLKGLGRFHQKVSSHVYFTVHRYLHGPIGRQIRSMRPNQKLLFTTLFSSYSQIPQDGFMIK